tara:strand:+ start:2264 stop:2452 length:189 start_codon:yes stop_codon:yes gene_type:complete
MSSPKATLTADEIVNEIEERIAHHKAKLVAHRRMIGDLGPIVRHREDAAIVALRRLLKEITT